MEKVPVQENKDKIIKVRKGHIPVLKYDTKSYLQIAIS